MTSVKTMIKHYKVEIDLEIEADSKATVQRLMDHLIFTHTPVDDYAINILEISEKKAKPKKRK